MFVDSNAISFADFTLGLRIFMKKAFAVTTMKERKEYNRNILLANNYFCLKNISTIALLLETLVDDDGEPKWSLAVMLRKS